MRSSNSVNGSRRDTNVCSHRRRTDREAGGGGIEPPYPAPKTGVLPLDAPPRLVARADTTMRRVPAPTVLILAAGEGTRMKSDTPKVLHPICGRPMIGWPIRAAQEA